MACRHHAAWPPRSARPSRRRPHPPPCGCWSHADGIRYWCENVSGAAVYGSIGNSRLYPNPNAVVGTMHSNPSWFYCKLDGQAHVGGPHPTRWLRTVADNGQYGWMKDTAIYSETDPVRDCYPS